LIVDDDPDARNLLEEDLSRAGYKTRSAAGGEQALAEIERERPSAVLLDLLMPEPDGFEVLYRIRKDPALSSLPVIVLTAKDLTPADHERLNGSAQRILRKGADMTRLVREVLKTTAVPLEGE
jgi:CheY-like chemotaxis protein